MNEYSVPKLILIQYFDSIEDDWINNPENRTVYSVFVFVLKSFKKNEYLKLLEWWWPVMPALEMLKFVYVHCVKKISRTFKFEKNWRFNKKWNILCWVIINLIKRIPDQLMFRWYDLLVYHHKSTSNVNLEKKRIRIRIIRSQW